LSFELNHIYSIYNPKPNRDRKGGSKQNPRHEIRNSWTQMSSVEPQNSKVRFGRLIFKRLVSDFDIQT